MRVCELLLLRIEQVDEGMLLLSAGSEMMRGQSGRVKELLWVTCQLVVVVVDANLVRAKLARAQVGRALV